MMRNEEYEDMMQSEEYEQFEECKDSDNNVSEKDQIISRTEESDIFPKLDLHDTYKYILNPIPADSPEKKLESKVNLLIIQNTLVYNKVTDLAEKYNRMERWINYNNNSAESNTTTTSTNSSLTTVNEDKNNSAENLIEKITHDSFANKNQADKLSLKHDELYNKLLQLDKQRAKTTLFTTPKITTISNSGSYCDSDDSDSDNSEKEIVNSSNSKK